MNISWVSAYRNPKKLDFEGYKNYEHGFPEAA